MRKSSSYVPKPVVRDPLNHARVSRQLADVPGGAITMLKVRNHMALEALRTGIATRQDMMTLIKALQLGKALAKKLCDLGQEVHIKQGYLTLMEVARRGTATDHYICRALELKNINEALIAHDEQLSECTVMQLEAALKGL